MAWLQFGSVFPLSVFFLPFSSSTFSSFIAAIPHFRLPLTPPFSGSGSPSWGSDCYIVANVGSRVSFNGSGKSTTAAILWDYVPAFLGNVYRFDMNIWSVYAPVLCSYPTAEVIYARLEIVAWSTWCFYLLNSKYQEHVNCEHNLIE